MASGVKAGLIFLGIAAAVTGLGFLIWYLVTKESFSQTVLRKCSEYIQNPKIPLSVSSDKDTYCTKLEETFKSAFISKDPCHITVQDYQPLINMVHQTISCNKVLFWSKTKKKAHEYAARNGLITLEATLLGNISDGLTWCSAQGSAAVKTIFCPKKSDSCPGPANSVFWDVASKWFAEKACGEVQVMLSQSVPNAFDSDSTFARVEVPNLKTGVVSSLRALMIHDHGRKIGDSCSGSSISNLRSILNGKNIPFSCTENRAAASTQGDLLFLSPARGGALLSALLVTLSSWTQI